MAQIAEAAEVSESTFFRYFSTKEDVVFWDGLDPLVFEGSESCHPKALSGAVMGVGLSAMFAAAEDPQADLLSPVDDGLAQL